MERCRLAQVCRRQDMVGCGGNRVVEKQEVVSQRIVSTDWDKSATEYTVLYSWCDGNQTRETEVGPSRPNLSGGQII